jgi:hypothetical protein
MARGDEEIRIEDTPVISIRADEALRTLARLIGRQMAREQFEPKQAAVRKRSYLTETNKIANSRTAPRSIHTV